MAILSSPSGKRQQLEAELAAVEQLLSRISHLEGRASKPDETHNPPPPQELPEERQSSSHNAGKSDAAFTKERRAVGARMTVASSSSDVRKRETEEGSSGGAASKRPKLSFDEENEQENHNGDHLNPDSGGEGGGSMSTLHSSEEASSQRRDEFDRFRSSWPKCLKILDDLKAAFPDAWVFDQPVLKLWPDLENYEKVIVTPMDLGTVRSRVQGRVYSNPSQYFGDVELTFKNAMAYNMKGSVYHQMAKALLQKFKSSFRAVERMLHAPKPKHPVAPPVAPLVTTPVVVTPPVAPVVKFQSPVHVPETQAISSPPRSLKWDPEPVKAYKHHHHHHHQHQHQQRGKKPNPRLGRQTNSAAYGGVRALSLKEKSKLKELVESFPSDRMGKVWQMLGEKMPVPQMGEMELDLDALDQETLFNIYRLAMNWQKSKNKVLHKKLREQGLEGGSQLQMPGDSSDNVDIGGDSPVHEHHSGSLQMPQQGEEEAEQQEESKRKDGGGDSSSSDGETSSSDSSSDESDDDDDDDGSSSEDESDAENGNANANGIGNGNATAGDSDKG